MFFCWHKWGKWSDPTNWIYSPFGPTGYSETGYFAVAQMRICEKCGLTQHRTLPKVAVSNRLNRKNRRRVKMNNIDAAFDRAWAEHGFKDTALADKSAMKELCRQFYGQITELDQQLSAITAERDALKARINHKSVGTAARYPGENEVAYLLHTKNDEEEAERDDMEVVKLYAAPIPSPDTQELIRKAEDAILNMVSDLWGGNYPEDFDKEFNKLIRSRSTKEK